MRFLVLSRDCGTVMPRHGYVDPFVLGTLLLMVLSCHSYVDTANSPASPSTPPLARPSARLSRSSSPRSPPARRFSSSALSGSHKLSLRTNLQGVTRPLPTPSLPSTTRPRTASRSPRVRVTQQYFSDPARPRLPHLRLGEQHCLARLAPQLGPRDCP